MNDNPTGRYPQPRRKPQNLPQPHLQANAPGCEQAHSRGQDHGAVAHRRGPASAPVTGSPGSARCGRSGGACTSAFAHTPARPAPVRWDRRRSMMPQGLWGSRSALPGSAIRQAPVPHGVVAALAEQADAGNPAAMLVWQWLARRGQIPPGCELRPGMHLVRGRS